MARERTCAFAPGRVNLIGEHTDYNDGLALPFAITEGITVCAQAFQSGAGAPHICARARDLGETDRFGLAPIPRAEGWRAFVRGTVAELAGAGFAPVAARLDIGGNLPRGAGLSSSAALEVALCLALLELDRARRPAEPQPPGRLEIARLCARVEHRWVGAQTGLLDQLAVLFGRPGCALCIDFSTLAVDPVTLALGGWRLALLDSGERHSNAASGYNRRRSECARACSLLGVRSLREITAADLERLPEPLARRASHVLDENDRVRAAVAALRAQDMPALARLLNASHESLRDLFEVSTPAVEAAVARLLAAGAAGARLVGGGFGGSVLGLFAPDVPPPGGLRQVRPGPGAHVLDALKERV